MLSLFIKWNVNPDIFTIFGREIRWYSLLWALGILGAAYIVSKIYKSEKLPEKWFDSLFWYVVIGVIIGARLGHCLFLRPDFFT
ncbi:MAG: prolipoprotein diacylglyceryl transferase family protein [Dysgonomonas sp.]